MQLAKSHVAQAEQSEQLPVKPYAALSPSPSLQMLSVKLQRLPRYTQARPNSQNAYFGIGLSCLILLL